MDAIVDRDLARLMAEHQSPCVSIYLPTHPSGRDKEQDPLVLRNSVDRAELQLLRRAQRSVAVRDFLRPLRDLVTDDAFWRDRSVGLAAFLAPDGFQAFRLPVEFRPLISAGAHFVVRPLLPLLVHEDRFLVLTLSQRRVRLLRGDRYALVPQEVPGLPVKMDENVIATDQGRKQMHMGGRDPSHGHSTIYHGHGGKPDARKDEIMSFLRDVDAALRTFLSNEHAPLILAGVASLLALFREVDSYEGLARLQLEANCDRLADSQLHRRVWPLAEEVLAGNRRRAVAAAYADVPPDHCVRDVRQILPAADHGRIALLLAATDACLFGSYDPSRREGALTIGSADEDDLVDLAAVKTLRHRGRVFVVEREEIPGCGDMAAILRR